MQKNNSNNIISKEKKHNEGKYIYLKGDYIQKKQELNKINNNNIIKAKNNANSNHFSNTNNTKNYKIDNNGKKIINNFHQNNIKHIQNIDKTKKYW